MITVEDALALERARPAGKRPKVALTDAERVNVDFLEATIEGCIRSQFTGKIFNVDVPAQYLTDNIAREFEDRCGEAGWQIVTMPVENEQVRITFAPARLEHTATPLDEEGNALKLPPLPLPLLPRATGGRRVLVRMPTRGRPAQALSVLEKYRRMAGAPVTIEVVVDHDDETMLSAEVVQRLAALNCILTVGNHGSKIEACNGGEVDDWDILVLASDDMVPVVDDYAARIIAAMQEHFPYLDGALFFNDGYQKSNLCTLPIMGRRLYDQFGHVYEPSYQSLFCDREQTDILQAMGRLAYVDQKIIEHRHHVWGRAVKDATYERNDALEHVDKEVYDERRDTKWKFSQWAFDAPPLWLSICICTVPSRRAQLDWLLTGLYRQINYDTPRQVEILVDDRRGVTVGEKRQALIERARGHYVAFIDDDDGVAHDYCFRVVQALGTYAQAHGELADCASLEGVMTTYGNRPEVFRHILACEEWHTKDGVHYRSPNHLNAVRRELALEVGFVSKNVGEDHDFSKRLKPLLKTEADTGPQPLYMYWFNPTRSVQAGAP